MTDTAPANMDLANGLIAKLGIVMGQANGQLAVATMPVEGNTQPYGLLHGGASAALAETVGSVAAMHHAGAGRIAVGVDLNITHIKAARAGTVTATATAVHLGRNIASYDVKITDDQGQLVAIARLTCHLRDDLHT